VYTRQVLHLSVNLNKVALLRNYWGGKNPAPRVAGMAVNGGHDLDLRNTPLLAREVPEMLEVSIGHALLADALYMGLEPAVRAYLRACAGNDVDGIPVPCRQPPLATLVTRAILGPP
jgi:pyridoxine 5'-phosphate synthase PdxJ